MGADAAKEAPAALQMTFGERVYDVLIRFVASPEIFFRKLFLVVLVVVVALLLHTVIMRLLRRWQRRLLSEASRGAPAATRSAQRAATMLSLVGNLAKWVLLLGAVIQALVITGINLVPVLTGAGILGVAIAFGAQTLVRDLMSGFFLLLEGQYSVGDYVTINAQFGRVEDVGLRVTALRDVDNRLIYLPNGAIASVVVYEQDRVDWILECPLVQAEQAEAAACALRELLAQARTEYPRYLATVSDPLIYAATDGTASLKVHLGLFPAQEWLVKEELAARFERMLKQSEVAVPEGAKPRAYLRLANAPQRDSDNVQVVGADACPLPAAGTESG